MLPLVFQPYLLRVSCLYLVLLWRGSGNLVFQCFLLDSEDICRIYNIQCNLTNFRLHFLPRSFINIEKLFFKIYIMVRFLSYEYMYNILLNIWQHCFLTNFDGIKSFVSFSYLSNYFFKSIVKYITTSFVKQGQQNHRSSAKNPSKITLNSKPTIFTPPTIKNGFHVKF